MMFWPLLDHRYWPSSVVLLIPLCAAIFLLPHAPALIALASGLTNTGYILLVSVIFGSFGVMGLNKRSSVLIAAFCFVVIGILRTPTTSMPKIYQVFCLS
jgi:hypothetical protein